MTVKDVTALGGRKRTELVSMMDPIVNLRREVDGLFNLIFGQMSTGQGTSSGLLPVDVMLTDKEMIVKADIPGVEQGDIQLKLEDNTLVINGQKSTEQEKREDNYYIMERGYGSFTRVLPIPFKTDVKEIEAELQNGVLTVKIPKNRDLISQDHHIKIKGK